MIIQHNGKMCNCCEDDHGAFDLGSIYDSSLEELWYSERHVPIVENLLAGLPNRLVGHGDPSLGQQVLGIAEAETEASGGNRYPW